MVALVEPGATRPCLLHKNHSGQHRYILRGQIVNAQGKPLNESPSPEAKDAG
jgi:hypothetical protein